MSFVIEALALGEIDVGDPNLQSRDAPIRKSFLHGDGVFTLDVRDGEWRLVAHNSDRRSTPLAVLSPASDAELILPRAASIQGRVLAVNGSPIAGASLFVRYAGDPLSSHASDARAHSDGKGEFVLDELQPGSIEVMAKHAEFADGEWTEVAAAPGATSRAVLCLDDGGRVVGRVDRSLGDVAGRRVHLLSLRGTIGWRDTSTDRSGDFAFEHVMPQTYIIELKPPGDPFSELSSTTPSIRRRIEVTPGRTTEVVFGASEHPVLVRGSVLRNGDPVIGARISAHSLEGAENPRNEAKSGSIGEFELELGGPGRHSFGVSSGEGSHTSFERSIDANGETTLVFEVPAGAIRGIVMSARGEPLAGIPVSVLLDTDARDDDPTEFWKRRYRRTKTNAQGRFEFAFLEPGTYVLRTPDGYRRDSPAPRIAHGGVVLAGLVVLGAEAEELKITLTDECRLSVRVRDRDGNPIAHALIQVFDERGVARCAAREIETDVTGSFVLDSLAPGTYTVVAELKERRGTSSPVEAIAGTTATAEVTLP